MYNFKIFYWQWKEEEGVGQGTEEKKNLTFMNNIINFIEIY